MVQMRTLAVFLVLTAVTLAGCLGGSDPGEDGGGSPAETGCAQDDLDCLCGGDRLCREQYAPTDEDQDGLTYLEELHLGTDPLDPDTDGDGVSDGDEVAAGTPPLIPWFPSDGASEKTFLEVPSFDDHLIPVTVYRPLVAGNTSKVPVLLHSHGFTGSRMTGDDDAKAYVAAGFGVVSFDERGHGDSMDDSEVHFMHPDWEVQDVLKVIDYISTLDWVLMEDNGNGSTGPDPVLGTIGGSYGGAFQLMGAVFDDRIDAMVPEITWYNITTALAPNGAIKSGWVDLFYLAGNAEMSVRFSNEFHEGFAWATASNELPAGQFGVVPDLVAGFNAASPQSYPGAITVPTLLVQGMPDTLFPLNHAVWNHDAIAATGAPVRIYTHNGGHVLNSESLAPGAVPVPVGLQGAPGGHPCGAVGDLNILWHQKWLLDLPVDLGPKYCISLEDDSAIIGDSWPLPGTEMLAIDLGGPWPLVEGAGVGTEVPMAAFTADQETVVAGIPRLKGTITAPGVDAIVYFSLQMVRADGALEHIVDDQVRPLRITGPNTGTVDFDIELGGVGTRLAEGDQVFLVASSVEPMFFGNAERIPGGVVLDDLELDLPIVVDPVFLESS